MFEPGEGGEDELFDEKSEDIDYNTVIKEDALAQDSDDSEEDIIASTIKKKQAKKPDASIGELQKEFDKKQSKKQKIEDND